MQERGILFILCPVCDSPETFSTNDELNILSAKNIICPYCKKAYPITEELRGDIRKYYGIKGEKQNEK